MEYKAAKGQRHLLFIGHQTLQNSVLIGYLYQQLQVNYRMLKLPDWSGEWFRPSDQTLVLIDTESMSLEDLEDLVTQICDQSAEIKIALFRVNRNHNLEKLIMWPQVFGLFYQDSTRQQLCRGIQGIFDGEYWLPRNLMAYFLEQNRNRPKQRLTNSNALTRREKQILKLTATGATNAEIAEQLNVSMHTVKTHIYNLFKKIGATNRIQAVNWAQMNSGELIDSREFR